MTTKAKKLGGSIAVVIPKSIAIELNISVGDTLDLSTSQNGLLISRQSRRRRPIEDIVAEIDPKAYARRGKELDDRPVGREIW